MRAEDVVDPSCDMHLLHLAAGLALSTVERRANGQVVNQWKPFLDLFKSLKTLVKMLFSKANRAKFDSYQKALLPFPVIRVQLPNHTRIAGVLILIQGSLRSMHALFQYSASYTPLRAKLLSSQQWAQLAQFEAIMYRGFRLCFESQGHRIEIAGEMILAIIIARSEYKFGKKYEVIDTEATEGWPATTPCHKLPRITMTIDPALSESKNIP